MGHRRVVGEWSQMKRSCCVLCLLWHLFFCLAIWPRQYRVQNHPHRLPGCRHVMYCKRLLKITLAQLKIGVCVRVSAWAGR